MATVQEIIDQGFNRSFKNRPDTIATDATELVSVVDRLQKEMFAFAAEENPEYFGSALIVVGVGGVWARPANAESIILILTTSGSAEVVVVPIDQKDVEAGYVKAVYEWGRQFFGAGNTGDPAGTESLTFYYSDVPNTLTALGDSLDSRWPDRFKPIYELGVAAYLAVKDGRPDDAAMFEGERGRWVKLFQQHLQHATANLTRTNRIPRSYLVRQQKPRGTEG